MKATYSEVLALAIKEKEQGHDVFIDYSPHVNAISIRIYKNGWAINTESHFNRQSYLEETTPEELIAFIENALSNTRMRSTTNAKRKTHSNH